VMYLWKPELPAKAAKLFKLPIRILENKYGMDNLWIDGFAGGGVKLGKASRAIDSHVIDGVVVNGSASLVGFIANLTRRVQSGYLYHYAFAMIIGLIVLLAVVIRFWH
ncbi:NADH-quinone oxidoreductase subunit L, partial [Lysobacter sp. 2RAB21]